MKPLAELIPSGVRACATLRCLQDSEVELLKLFNSRGCMAAQVQTMIPVKDGDVIFEIATERNAIDFKSLLVPACNDDEICPVLVFIYLLKRASNVADDVTAFGYQVGYVIYVLCLLDVVRERNPHAVSIGLLQQVVQADQHVHDRCFEKRRFSLLGAKDIRLEESYASSHASRYVKRTEIFVACNTSGGTPFLIHQLTPFEFFFLDRNTARCVGCLQSMGEPHLAGCPYARYTVH